MRFVAKHNFWMLLLALFLFSWTGKNVSAQAILNPDFVVVSGYVFDVDKDSVLTFANVYNTRTMRGTITDRNGFFRYYALPGDTLWFSSMGYYPLQYKIIDDPGSRIQDTFYLKARTYKIPDVDILALTRYEKLRYEVKNMEVPRDVKNARNNFPVVNHNVNAFYERNSESFGLIMSPISALYDAFSKEGKERRKLAELMRQDAIDEKIALKYNEDLVNRVTGFEGDLLIEFMEFCNFSEEFLLNAPDYYLIEILIEQYQAFCVLKKMECNNK